MSLPKMHDKPHSTIDGNLINDLTETFSIQTPIYLKYGCMQATNNQDLVWIMYACT
jgi:hypothetical protein